MTSKENNKEILNAIEVKNISKKFTIPHDKVSTLKGAFVNLFKKNNSEIFYALSDVSFEIKKGEFFGIIGRNGSGKSTLLKILAGIYRPNKGVVKINGRISPFLELGIGFNPELSGRDNVYLNATVLGLTKKEIDRKFDSIVAFSELERFIDQKLKNYSSGMNVRLAFSVAIHANRDILLMDEVLAVGDANFQSKCLAEFAHYKEMGKTVVLVTHDISTVQRYCDRAMLVRNGRIEMIGNPEEVGNEYIYQNMSDEEKRIYSEEKRKINQAEEDLASLKGQALENELKRIEDEKIKLEEEKKNKIAEITEVKFLDKDGKEKNVFETGEDITIRVYFKKRKNIDKLNFGIALFNQENNCIFGTNTFINKINTSQMLKNGFFNINYKGVSLRTNSYYIQAGIWGDIVTVNYDFLSKSKIFKVFTKDQNIGIININHSWN